MDKIRELYNGQIARYRIGRAGDEDVIWEDWKIGPLYVQKREIEMPKKFRHRVHAPMYEKGAVLIVTPQNESTAEYSEIDYSYQFDVFNCEDYYFQIDWEFSVDI